MKIDVLGEKYTIIKVPSKETEKTLGEDRLGECDSSIRQLRIVDYTNHEAEPHEIGDLPRFQRKLTRHEIIHAFLFESGLAENSEWAQCEEMVDWFAFQFYKLAKAFQQAGCAEVGQ